MPIPSIRLNKNQTEAVRIARRLGEDGLAQVTEALHYKQPTISQRRIQGSLSAVIGAEDGRRFARFLVNAALYLRRRSVTAKEFVEAISNEISSSKEYDDQFRSDWEKCQPRLEALIALPSVHLSAKAMDLSYDFERIYMSGRLITSIRPVFADDERTAITGSTVVQTLRIEYASLSGELDSVSVALDLDDVRHLAKSCRLALSKAKASAELMSERADVETIVVGEEDE